MYGAFLGDMIGAPYEFDQGDKTKVFPLFTDESQFTDDSVMTAAVAEALLDTLGQPDDEIKAALVSSLLAWGRKYPGAGYGGRFIQWLSSEDPQPYGSCGNGSAMRVSAAGWLYDSLEETRKAARLTAEITHNHPEGVKGAEATASAIYLARTGSGKEEIKEYVEREFGYDLSRTCDEIRPHYFHIETCQKTVPEAITAFLEGVDFEDVIRTAVSLGGDCDTLTCIAGSIAEAFYGVPAELIDECRRRLPEDILEVTDRFQDAIAPFHDSSLDGNEIIEQAIAAYYEDSTEDTLKAVLEAVHRRISEGGHFIFPAAVAENGTDFGLRSVQGEDGRDWLAAFTSPAEFEKGELSQILSSFIGSTLQACRDSGFSGMVINPWGRSFALDDDLIDLLLATDAPPRTEE